MGLLDNLDEEPTPAPVDQIQSKGSYFHIETSDGSPLPLEWFIAFRDLMRVVAKAKGIKEMQNVDITIWSQPFSPEWKRKVDARLQYLEDVHNDAEVLRLWDWLDTLFEWDPYGDPNFKDGPLEDKD
jgi:hypothetical protein